LNSKENDVEEACEKPNCDKSVGRGETREGCIYYHESDSKNDRRMHHHEFWKKVKKVIMCS
jgi:hypothetical protein